MVYLVAAVVLLAGVAVINLLLTIGVIGRLRDHAAALKSMQDSSPGFALSPGDQIPDFVAEDLDHRLVSRESIAGREALMGFFSASCRACEIQLPEFLQAADAMRRQEAEVVAVVSGSGDEQASLVEKLRQSVRVIPESEYGPVTSTMEVRGFPVFYHWTPDGVLVSAAHDVRRLVAPTPA